MRRGSRYIFGRRGGVGTGDLNADKKDQEEEEEEK